MMTYKLEYEEPRDRALERKIFAADDYWDIDDEVTHGFDTETDEGYEENAEAMKRLRAAVLNLFIRVYNLTDTPEPPDDAWRLILEMTDGWCQDYSDEINVRSLLRRFYENLKF